MTSTFAWQQSDVRCATVCVVRLAYAMHHTNQTHRLVQGGIDMPLCMVFVCFEVAPQPLPVHRHDTAEGAVVVAARLQQCTRQELWQE